MSATRPLVETRTARGFVEATEAHLEELVGWEPPPGGGDRGTALVHVFARMAEVVADRLNQVPERNLLAFLNLLGVDLLPPHAARVPLTFALAEGAAEDALVPARTPVAATPREGEAEPPVFETERELVVTRSRLVAALVRDPLRDRGTDASARAAGGAPFRVFEGEAPLEHRVYLGDPRFATEGAKSVTLRFAPADAGVPWPGWIRWSFRAEEGWLPLAPGAVARDGDGWRVTLAGLPTVPEAEVLGRRGAWISGLLTVPLRERGVAPEWGFTAPPAGLRGGEREDRVYPFGWAEPRDAWYLAAPAVFALAGARATLRVELDPAHRVLPGGGLELAWEYSAAGGAWRELGRSSEAEESVGGDTSHFRDGTRALTSDGGVELRVPADWAPAAVGGVERLWLRARVAAGSYGTDDAAYPPVLLRVRLDAELSLPPVAAVESRVEMQATGLVPDAVLAAGVAVEPHRDFFPFGETPRIGDAVYLSCRALADKPGARVVLSVVLTNPSDAAGTPRPALANGAVLSWEYWNRDAGRWELLGTSRSDGAPGTTDFGLADGTRAFTVGSAAAPARVTFVRPPAMGEVEVDGRSEPWIRARLSAGNYGREAAYEKSTAVYPGTSIPVYLLTPADVRPPSVRSVEVGYAYEAPWGPVPLVATENDFAVAWPADGTGPAGAFVPFTPSPETEPALYLGWERPGDARGFDNRLNTLYLGAAAATYDELAADGAAAEPASVVWEYWDGSRWAHLGARDETAALTRRGLLEFVGPPSFPLSTRFGRAAFWLRARLERGGYPVPPVLERVLPNTTWAAHTVRTTDETLGSGNGEPGQAFRTTRAPVLPGETLEVREPELPSAEERESILAEAGPDAIRVVEDEAGRPAEVWVRWTRVPDFFGSGPRSRHYTLERWSGAVGFGDGRRGMIPPRGRGNVRLAAYLSGGGPEGNRPAGSVSALRTTVPYVAAVANPEPAAGGAAGESVAQARLRGPRTIRHRDRAVALADYEDLAFEASPELALAHAVPPGVESVGTVALVVVPRGAEARPAPSLELLARVREHVGARVSPTVELVVQGPDWARVTVAAEVVPARLEAASEVHAAVLARVAAFLHPLTGGSGGGGWPFGRRPHRSDLYALLETTPGVDHVRALEVATDEMPHPERSLVYGGGHRIAVVGLADA